MSYLNIDHDLINNIINKINNNEDVPFDNISPMNYSERDWTYLFIYLTKYCQIFKKDKYCEKICRFWISHGKYMTSKLLVDFFITENVFSISNSLIIPSFVKRFNTGKKR